MYLEYHQTSTPTILEKLFKKTPIRITYILLIILAINIQDLRQLIGTRQTDLVFDLISILIILLFTIEIILRLLDNRFYYKSIFFILDLIGIVSLVLSIISTVIDGKNFPIYGLISFSYRVIYLFKSINNEINLLTNYLEKNNFFKLGFFRIFKEI